MDKVMITCMANNMSMAATLVTKTNDMLKVHLPASDSVIVMRKDRFSYTGKSAGLEFTSDGKVIKENI